MKRKEREVIERACEEFRAIARGLDELIGTIETALSNVDKILWGEAKNEAKKRIAKRTSSTRGRSAAARRAGYTGKKTGKGILGGLP